MSLIDRKYSPTPAVADYPFVLRLRFGKRQTVR
jgi:hypothetical protein